MKFIGKEKQGSRGQIAICKSVQSLPLYQHNSDRQNTFDNASINGFQLLAFLSAYGQTQISCHQRETEEQQVTSPAACICHKRLLGCQPAPKLCETRNIVFKLWLGSVAAAVWLSDGRGKLSQLSCGPWKLVLYHASGTTRRLLHHYLVLLFHTHF